MKTPRKLTWSELKSRRLVQWTLTYLAAAWLVFQIVGVLAQGFAWAVVLLRVTAVVLAMGFFAALVIAWNHGEKGRQRITAIELGLLAAILAAGSIGLVLLRRSGSRPADAAAVVPALPPANSIAVLPFAGMSDAADSDYFSDGITEDLINALSRMPQLRVIGRTSVFAFRDTQLSADDVAEQLHVRRLLTGSVQRAGDRVRIRVELVNAPDGAVLWSETFDRNLQDIFAVQDEISRAVVGRLNLTLAEDQRLVRPTTIDVSAYNLYLQGKFFWNRRTAPALARAIDLFEKAIQVDTTFALAYVGLADAYSWLADRGFASHNSTQPRAMAAARRALALDASLAEAHASLGHLLMHEFDYAASEREFRRAIELNPNYARARGFYAILLAWTRRSEDARLQVEQALVLDPLENQPIGVFTLFGEPDRTIKLAREALQRDPQTMWARIALVSALANRGDLADAVAEARAAVQLAGGYHPEATPKLAETYARAGNDKREPARDQ